MLYTPRRMLKIYALKAAFGACLLFGVAVLLFLDFWTMGLIGMMFVTSTIFLLSVGFLVADIFFKNYAKARHYWKQRNRVSRQMGRQ